MNYPKYAGFDLGQIRNDSTISTEEGVAEAFATQTKPRLTLECHSTLVVGRAFKLTFDSRGIILLTEPGFPQKSSKKIH